MPKKTKIPKIPKTPKRPLPDTREVVASNLPPAAKSALCGFMNWAHVHHAEDMPALKVLRKAHDLLPIPDGCTETHHIMMDADHNLIIAVWWYNRPWFIRWRPDPV